MAYPAHRVADVVLRDGSTVRVRPVRASDQEALHGFLDALSEEARWLRFFSGATDMGKAARWAADVDYRDRYGLVATTGPEDRIVAHAAYTRAGERAEISFEVADDHRGRGVGTILLAHLAEHAAASGIATLEASVLPVNHRMIEVFRESGFPVQMRAEPGMIHVEFPASLTPEALDRFEGRDRAAAVAAVRGFLHPRAVAVIGASRARGTIGGETFHNLLATGFSGPVYPVNPKAGVVQSVLAYPSVRDIPGPVDLAVIVVPAAAVEDMARECAEKGVRALVVISSGFSEVGGEGAARQRRLVEVCRENGMRLIGPNCLGILNTDPEVRLNATFVPEFPPPGRVGFLSQSGALGIAVINSATALGMGLSQFVSAGNKADLSGNDFIQYWEADEGTGLILLYLESFGNPRKFARIARRVSRAKPIVAVKSGRSAAGARATSSHTGAMLAASDVTVDALFRQTGAIRTDTLAEMFDVAALLANQPLPPGNRVAIVTNAGGPAILCADACESNGLSVPPLPEEARARLRSFLPPEASTGNPVDMIASAPAEGYRRAIAAVAACEEIDAIIAIFIPPLVTRGEDVAREIRAAADELPRAIPVLAVMMSAGGAGDVLRAGRSPIPSYSFPEDAARALSRAARHADWRRRPEGGVRSFADARRGEAAAVIAAGEGTRWLGPDEVATLLSCYGVPLVEWRLAAYAAEAGRAARALGGPVALKGVAPSLVHKTEAGGVRLGLRGAATVSRAAAEIGEQVERAGHRVERFLVQRMAPPGVEMFVGMVHDPVFGPVVACGAGGTAVELLHDVAVRITPLTDLDASEMIHSLATFPLLDGYRGAPRADVAALEEILARVSALVEEHAEIAEMDLNPVIVLPDGACVVDARVRVDLARRDSPVTARLPG
ncbi:MAG: GNAT family N-acetyltransferase [Acidobacteria bacterium]|nr:GNAT family N-acetyltransferase [Acidobacteriota bacterium]